MVALLVVPLPSFSADERQALFVAIKVHDPAAIRQALEDGADVNSRNSKGRLGNETPLALAVKLKQSDTVSLLLEHGADIDLRVGFWRNLSPLYLAVADGNLAMSKQLVDAGAKVEPNRWSGLWELLSAPVDLLKGDVVDLRRPPSLLEAAQKSGNAELMKYLQEIDAR